MKQAILVGALVIASSSVLTQAQDQSAGSNEDEMVGPAHRVVSTLEGEHPAALQASMDRSLGERHAELAQCFPSRLGERWFVRLRVADGRVTTASAELEGTRNAQVSRCVTDALRGLRTPAQLGASVVVRMDITRAGFGGLGIRGTGAGGGGTGEGTIGLGNLGTIGHGSGTGTGYGSMSAMQGSQPTVRAGSAAVRGSLSREVIQRVIRRHINQVRYCYERELASTPSLAGTLRARFVINPQGGVASVDVSNVEGDLGEVPACIAGAIRRWQFPEPAGGGIVIVIYPFVLATAR